MKYNGSFSIEEYPQKIPIIEPPWVLMYELIPSSVAHYDCDRIDRGTTNVVSTLEPSQDSSSREPLTWRQCKLQKAFGYWYWNHYDPQPKLLLLNTYFHFHGASTTTEVETRPCIYRRVWKYGIEGRTPFPLAVMKMFWLLPQSRLLSIYLIYMEAYSLKDNICS